MTAEEDRTRLIGDIARVLREGPVPDDARAAALTFIGWLARRMPGEPVSHCDTGRCTGKPSFAPKPPPGPLSEPRRRRDSGYSGPPSGAHPRAALLPDPPAAELRPRPRSAR
jgi:hypothetical protein